MLWMYAAHVEACYVILKHCQNHRMLFLLAMWNYSKMCASVLDVGLFTRKILPKRQNNDVSNHEPLQDAACEALPTEVQKNKQTVTYKNRVGTRWDQAPLFSTHTPGTLGGGRGVGGARRGQAPILPTHMGQIRRTQNMCHRSS